MTGRFAIYFVPHMDSLLWRLGCQWLGRDAMSGEGVPPLLPSGLPAERYEEIAGPARLYGFHATLKPPFALRAGTNVTELEGALVAFAQARRPFAVASPDVSRIGAFVALTLSARSAMLDRLCADCIAELDGFRAPAPAEELAKRRKSGLTPRQEELLVKWGYPYVMEEWLFHMTLTCALQGAELDLIEAHLKDLFRPVTAAPLFVDRIALFHQESREAPFIVHSWYRLGAGSPERTGPAADAKVEEASIESMDGSDPPGYYALHAGRPMKRPR